MSCSKSEQLLLVDGLPAILKYCIIQTGELWKSNRQKMGNFTLYAGNPWVLLLSTLLLYSSLFLFKQIACF